MATRRAFTRGLFGAGTALALGPRPATAVPVRSAETTPAPAEASPGAAPTGELGARLALSTGRLTDGGLPAYTRDFVLADVTGDAGRRFTEYSGDLSGRYVEALSVLPPAAGPDLQGLVREIVAHQRADGRFGNPDLRYTADEIGGLHMAQLWGNGRLLLGLVQYHLSSGDAESLAAARRLADFLAGVRAQTAEPAVAARLRGQGAMGIVCFTQLVEPLVLLARATGEGRHYEEARRIAPALGPRGIQHAHGYLTTLRGMVALAEATGDGAVLAVVEGLYADLVASPDLCPLGGVLEYFGWGDPHVSDDDRKALLAASGQHPRDEGCAVADFLRLSLALHRATERPGYLDRAERCLVNHFCFNQFATGDFGHRAFFEQGILPTESVGRAWWCCTLHGYRAFRDVLDSVVRVADGTARVDLYQDADWAGGGLALALRYRAESPLRSRLEVDVRRATREAALALRWPAWAESVAVTVNGARADVRERDGSLEIRQRLLAGDRVEAVLAHRARVETRDGRRLAPAEVEGEVEGLLFLGPWLYAVDDGLEPLFFGEPWKGENVVSLPAALAAPATTPPPGPFEEPRRHLAASYTHGGFAGLNPLVLRPIAEQTGRSPGTVGTWLRYRSEA
jgi:hypothetical protein